MILEKVEKGEWAIDGCSQSRSLSVNGESLDFPGEITHRILKKPRAAAAARGFCIKAVSGIWYPQFSQSCLPDGLGKIPFLRSSP